MTQQDEIEYLKRRIDFCLHESESHWRWGLAGWISAFALFAALVFCIAWNAK